MSTLTDFLLARIAEDEAEANAMLQRYREGGDVSSQRWRRVLAECEAKQRIVEREVNSRTKITYRRRLVLQDLASIYANHPDFDEAWRS